MAYSAFGAALFALVGPLLAQHTWRVDCQNGPGTDFTDLPPAVLVASPGDTIVVIFQGGSCPGLPEGYSAATIDKPLSILGAVAAALAPVGAPVPGRIGLHGTLTVRDIPAGSQVVLSNLVLSMNYGWPTAEFSVRNCAGSVLVEDLIFLNSGFLGQVVRIEDCADVTVRGCSFQLAGEPLYVVDSTVLMTTSEIYHVSPAQFGGFPLPGAYTQNAPGMSLTNATVTLAGSSVEGMGRRGSFPNEEAQPGVVLQDSTLRIGASSLVLGGGTGAGAWWGYTAANPATSHVHLDPRAVVNYLSQYSMPQPIATAIDVVFHSWTIGNEPYGVTVAGPANGFALLALGEYATSPVPTPFGTMALEPIGMQMVDLVALPASDGVHQWVFPCPGYAPVGTAFAFQALTLSPSGAFGMTVASPLAVAWPHGVDP